MKVKVYILEPVTRFGPRKKWHNNKDFNICGKFQLGLASCRIYVNINYKIF